MGATFAPDPAEPVEISFVPAWGQTPLGDADLPRVVDCVNSLGVACDLALGETAITDAAAPHLARLRRVTSPVP